jgi:tetratricopeptide (TPR) repeat protein
VARLRLEWFLEAGGDAARAGRDLRESLAHAEGSLAINPAFPNAHMLQGDLHLLEARLAADRAAALRALDAAEAAYREARRLNPKLMVAHLGLGTVALRRAERTGDLRALGAAEASLAEARRIREDHWEPCLRLAEVALLRTGPGPAARRWLAAARERNGAAREVRALEARLEVRPETGAGAAARPSGAGSRGR